MPYGAHAAGSLAQLSQLLGERRRRGGPRPQAQFGGEFTGDTAQGVAVHQQMPHRQQQPRSARQPHQGGGHGQLAAQPGVAEEERTHPVDQGRAVPLQDRQVEADDVQGPQPQPRLARVEPRPQQRVASDDLGECFAHSIGIDVQGQPEGEDRVVADVLGVPCEQSE